MDDKPKLIEYIEYIEYMQTLIAMLVAIKYIVLKEKNNVNSEINSFGSFKC